MIGMAVAVVTTLWLRGGRCLTAGLVVVARHRRRDRRSDRTPHRLGDYRWWRLHGLVGLAAVLWRRPRFDPQAYGIGDPGTIRAQATR